MKRHERIAAVIVVLGGLAVACYGFAVLKLGSILQPDAGFMPFLSGVALVVLGICWFTVTRGPGDRQKQAFFEKGRWGKPALALALMLVYAWTIEAAGYVSSTLLFMVVWQVLVERERWGKTLLISLSGTAAMFVLFRYLLKVPLPPEIFVR